MARDKLTEVRNCNRRLGFLVERPALMGALLAVLMAGGGWGCSGSSSESLIIVPTSTPTPTVAPTPTPTLTPTPTATSTPAVVISGIAVQGAMAGATVEAFNVNIRDGSNGTSLGSAVTDANGAFSIPIAVAPTGPVRLVATGGSFSSEQNGASIGSPSPVSMPIADGSASVSNVSINPLSLFVDSRTVGLLKKPGTTFSAALSAALKQVEGLYGLASDPSTLAPIYTAAGIGTDAGNLGLVLGALINADQLLCPAKPGGLVTALGLDIADGVFDGRSFGAAISYCGGQLAAIAGTAAYEDALCGIWGLQLTTSGFAFGGAGNVLTANGVTAAMLLPALVNLDAAIHAAAPLPVNSFAAAAAKMNAGREVAAATLLNNAMVLIAGGQQFPAGVTLSSTELYNSAANCFAGEAGTACAAVKAPDMTVARDDATATLLPNGKTLIAGGESLQSGDDTGTTDLYDSVNNCFGGQAGTPCASQTTAVMNLPRDSAAAVMLPNGLVLVAGGFSQTEDTTTSELYDPANNCFAGEAATPCAARITPKMKVARDSALSFLLPNGIVLLAGGENFNLGTSLASTELYDPAGNCFAGEAGTACAARTTPTMNLGRFVPAGVLLPNGKVLIAGGFDSTNGTVLKTVELYDPVNNCFAGEGGTKCAGQTTPVMNTERAGATASLLPNGKVLIAGGFNFKSPFAVDSTELYDSINNCFAGEAGTACATETPPPPMTLGRALATATLLPNGKILIAGGSGPEGVSQNTTDLYTP